MEKGFLDRVEDNAAVRTWAEMTQCEKAQTNLQELKEIWDQWNDEWVTARIKQKGNSKCIPWKSLKDLILAHPDVRKKVDVFALSIYGLVMFPKTLGHVDEAVTDLFDRLEKRVTPVPAMLAETFRSLNACRRAGEGRFIGCAQLLLAWFHSHFWRVDKVSYRNLQEGDIKWRAPWLLPDEILYQCGDFDWVPLIGVWGAVGYAPLLVLRQYSAWSQIRRMKGLAVGPMTTPEYGEWWAKRINDNIPGLGSESSQSIEEYLRVVPTELEIIKQDFEKKSAELEKKIEQIEEEKMNLRLDADVQKLEADKLRKGKNEAEEELDSLKTDYKKLRLSMRTAGLGKTSEQWREEIR
ncbi:hypothetical protein Gotur_034100, partial [Gossypium turneri]